MFSNQHCHVIIFGNNDEFRSHLPRTRRSLEASGIPKGQIGILNLDSLPIQNLGDEAVWFIQAGAWLPTNPTIAGTAFSMPLPSMPLPSASGRPLCGLGFTVLPSNERSLIETECGVWQTLLQESCGHIESANELGRRLPTPRSFFLAPQLTNQFCFSLNRGLSVAEAIRSLVASPESRTIHWRALDVHYDRRLRIAQVITSLQRGGAERIAIDLHENLPQGKHQTMLLSLGAPGRQAFEKPARTVDLSQLGLNRVSRLEGCKQACQDFAADLIHTHLLRNPDLESLLESGIPITMTIHNTKSGWQDRLAELKKDTVALLVACSLAVEDEVLGDVNEIPVRTVWNGIKMPQPDRASGIYLQQEESDFILTAIANPRPQKRLERLPEIAAELQRQLRLSGSNRRVKLLIAGEASKDNELAKVSVESLCSAIAKGGMESQIELLGPVTNIAELLSRTDCLVSAASHEGLSLAHLEALACDVPVVATDVGGTREIASKCSGLMLVNAEARSEEFANALLDVTRAPKQSFSDAIQRDFSTMAMTAAYSRLYQRAISSQSRSAGTGLLLVINNFSTGGAQTSARRLLTGLRAKGVAVRAVVLQEARDFPTVGRQSLTSKGIDVMVLPCAGSIDPLIAIQPLLTSIDRDPPQTIVFWNAISEYKLLIADSIWGIPIVDVSPGEMLYSSFDRYWNRTRPGLAYRNGRDYGRRLSKVVVKYEAERATAESYFGTEVHVVRNGVSIKPAVDLLQPRPEVLIGTVARISHQKKLEELIEAIRLAKDKLPSCRVQIVGGVERGSEEYAARLRELGQGLSIEWIGEKEDPGEYLATWDVFVLIAEPAGCPNAGLEAMSHGLPLVATDAGGASEQVVNELNGLLVPRGDVRQLADAIIQLANSPSLRDRYGKASHHRAATLFGEARMTEEYSSILGV
jgi:glycosyltransferase involved in cell wall biosynthesis